MTNDNSFYLARDPLVLVGGCERGGAVASEKKSTEA